MAQGDRQILRELGKRVADAAAAADGAATVALWKRLNALQPVRPLVMIDQLPWNELNDAGELTLHCTDPFLRGVEGNLRQRLYAFTHFPVDRPLHADVPVPRCVRVENALRAAESTLATDPANSVVSHAYQDQIPDDAALARIRMPEVVVDEAEDRRRLALASEIFDGVLPVFLAGPNHGYSFYCGMWDQITMLRGAERVLYDIIDRPEFSLRVIDTFMRMAAHQLDQYEALGLLDVGAPLVHCTGAYTDQLPSPAYDGRRARAADVWAFGLAQVFSTISPDMHDEFEIQPMKPLLERFGLLYYGCCDPMDRKVGIVRKLRNLRKISISPWADPERGASEMRGDYVLSYKPNPSHLAADRFDEALVRRELQQTVDACRRHGTPCELILKDVSTVRYEPQRLAAWARIAMDVARNG